MDLGDKSQICEGSTKTATGVRAFSVVAPKV